MGRAPAALQTAAMWSRPFFFLQACRRRYGDIFTVRATGHPPLVFCSDPAGIRTITSAAEMLLLGGQGASPVCPIVGGRSFMLADGHEHLAGRRQALSIFGFRNVRLHAAMVQRAAARAIASWPRDTPLSLHPRLRALTLEVILRTVTGRHDGPLDTQLSALMDAVLRMLEITSSPVLTEPYLRHGLGGRRWQRFVGDREAVDRMLFELIGEALRDGSSPLAGIARSLAAAGVEPSPKRLRDHLMSIVLAGHETTAAQVTWAFQLLAHNPSAQATLAAETRAGGSDRYLAATIQEVLRHRCVFVFGVPRVVRSRFELADHTIHAPAQLLCGLYLLHHDAALYPSPDRFMPERFMGRPPDPGIWMPWGAGRKRCPGLHMATMEMETVLSTTLRELKIEPANRSMERPRWRSVIVAPHAGGRVVLRSRQRSAASVP